MIITGAFASLLAGVSQQVPRERITGQLSDQLNMLSDPVTGLRRRPGAKREVLIPNFTSDPKRVYSQYLEVDNKRFHIFVNTVNGEVVVLDENYSITSRTTFPYLIASDASKIRSTSVQANGWLCNVEQVPVKGGIDSTKRNPVHDGFFMIRTGAFQKGYTIRVEAGAWAVEVGYTTDSTAANSTPEGVAAQLYTQFTNNTAFMAKFDIYRNGAYVCFTKKNKSPTDLNQVTVTSPSGSVYVGTSQGMKVAQISDLPAKLDVALNGAVCAVGTSKLAMQYFIWNNNTVSWDETGDYNSAVSVTNVPIQFSVSSTGVLTATQTAFKGRTAGDDYNNPYPNFFTKGITGMSTFQGRLVILSGAYTSLSDSTDSLQFMRSTVTSTTPTNALEIGTGSASSAAFEHAVQFNKNLMLFSATHQAVIPTQNAAINANNALVLLTSKQDLSMKAPPVVLGRTLMCCAPTSAEYFGVCEFQPSQFTDAQYMPQNLTDHIPRYIKGRARHIVGSNTSNIALFSSDTSLQELLVLEFMWDGPERKQMAFHRWTMPLPVSSMHFARDVVVIALAGAGNNLVVCTIDPRASTYLGASARPFLDCWSFGTVANNQITVSGAVDSGIASSLRLAVADGDMAGEPIGIESISGNTLRTVRSFPSGNVAYGIPFTSRMIPTPPMMRDKNNVVISTMKTTIMRYDVTVQRSGEFSVNVSNSSEGIYSDANTSGMTWSSSELNPGLPLVSGVGSIKIPCRSLSHETTVVLETDGTRELNILDIEYILRVESRPDRRRL